MAAYKVCQCSILEANPFIGLGAKRVIPTFCMGTFNSGGAVWQLRAGMLIGLINYIFTLCHENKSIS
jgi:hypothetical protein